MAFLRRQSIGPRVIDRIIKMSMSQDTQEIILSPTTD